MNISTFLNASKYYQLDNPKSDTVIIAINTFLKTQGTIINNINSVDTYTNSGLSKSLLRSKYNNYICYIKSSVYTGDTNDDLDGTNNPQLVLLNNYTNISYNTNITFTKLDSFDETLALPPYFLKINQDGMYVCSIVGSSDNNNNINLLYKLNLNSITSSDFPLFLLLQDDGSIVLYKWINSSFQVHTVLFDNNINKNNNNNYILKNSHKSATSIEFISCDVMKNDVYLSSILNNTLQITKQSFVADVGVSTPTPLFIPNLGYLNCKIMNANGLINNDGTNYTMHMLPIKRSDSIIDNFNIDTIVSVQDANILDKYVIDFSLADSISRHFILGLDNNKNLYLKKYIDSIIDTCIYSNTNPIQIDFIAYCINTFIIYSSNTNKLYHYPVLPTQVDVITLNEIKITDTTLALNDFKIVNIENVFILKNNKSDLYYYAESDLNNILVGLNFNTPITLYESINKTELSNIEIVNINYSNEYDTFLVITDSNDLYYFNNFQTSFLNSQVTIGNTNSLYLTLALLTPSDISNVFTYIGTYYTFGNNNSNQEIYLKDTYDLGITGTAWNLDNSSTNTLSLVNYTYLNEYSLNGTFSLNYTNAAISSTQEGISYLIGDNGNNSNNSNNNYAIYSVYSDVQGVQIILVNYLPLTKLTNPGNSTTITLSQGGNFYNDFIKGIITSNTYIALASVVNGSDNTKVDITYYVIKSFNQ